MSGSGIRNRVEVFYITHSDRAKKIWTIRYPISVSFLLEPYNSIDTLLRK